MSSTPARHLRCAPAALILAMLSLAAFNAGATPRTVYQGTLQGAGEVVLELDDAAGANGVVSGRYFYPRSGVDIPLRGTDDVLYEPKPHLDKRFEQMSTGTRRKVYLTAAALGDPAVVIADGPSNGLDTPARRALAELFKAWGRDRVVLFASHDPELVQACGAAVVDVAALR
ncbi:MAG: hypothetical protein KBO59_03625 [Achromobacter sp.]|nr:hypothetical protein [Achromobacter sp.]